MSDMWSCLTAEQRTRLYECRSRKEDIPAIARCYWVKNRHKIEGYTKEDALAQAFDILDCNGQWYDPTREEYENMIEQI